MMDMLRPKVSRLKLLLWTVIEYFQSKQYLQVKSSLGTSKFVLSLTWYNAFF
jgi:hypothetical protein